jgi:hypothetical protein
LIKGLHTLWKQHGKVSTSNIKSQQWSRIWPWGSFVLTTRHPPSAKVGTNFAEKRRSLCWYSWFAE